MSREIAEAHGVKVVMWTDGAVMVEADGREPLRLTARQAQWLFRAAGPLVLLEYRPPVVAVPKAHS